MGVSRPHTSRLSDTEVAQLSKSLPTKQQLLLATQIIEASIASVVCTAENAGGKGICCCRGLQAPCCLGWAKRAPRLSTAISRAITHAGDIQRREMFWQH